MKKFIYLTVLLLGFATSCGNDDDGGEEVEVIMNCRICTIAGEAPATFCQEEDGTILRNGVVLDISEFDVDFDGDMDAYVDGLPCQEDEE